MTTFSDRPSVHGSLSTVNGKIRLRDTRVGENVQTSNADIPLVDANSSVMGDIHLYREVNLDIADGAGTSKIIEHF